MAKTIFVLLDGCRYDTAQENCGFLEHMAETKKAAKYRVRGELPSTSRPMYETLLTGVPVWEHGVANNPVVRRSREESVFGLCRKNGLKTAAAAYSWISELYVSAPFSPEERFQFHTDGEIQNGIYYYDDGYPDSHLIEDAEFLRKSFEPDFLMVHTMSVDNMGHRYGAPGKEYNAAANTVDVLLSLKIPAWLEAGYQVLVTADHGMDQWGSHGGNTREQREAPLYLFSRFFETGDFTGQQLSQLAVAPVLCRMLEIKPGEKMADPKKMGVRVL